MWGRRGLQFYTGCLGGLTKEVTFELRPQGGEGRSEVDTCKKRAPGRGNSMCNGPGAGPCLEYGRNLKEAPMTGAE